MSVEPVVPISALEHHLYCPRQCALIHVDRLWLDNEHTVRGRASHRRVDEGPSRIERGKRMLRGIPLWSETYGLSGRADAVEIGLDDGVVAPVEYKAGQKHGDTAHVQLCAEALCLEEMLRVPIPRGFLWFSARRRREVVHLDERLRAQTMDAVEEVRQVFVSQRLPPAVDDARCSACQLRDFCLPTVSAHPASVAGYVMEHLGCDC